MAQQESPFLHEDCNFSTTGQAIVVGGGISGLALAFFLQSVYNIKCTVLERDSSFDGRNQGFSLTLQHETKKILQACPGNLLEEISQLGCRAVRQQFFYSDEAEAIYSNNENDVERFNYPVPRKDVRNMFFSRLQPGTVHWDSHVVEVSLLKEEGPETSTRTGEEEIVEVKCQNNKSYRASLVFACDGIHSKIRKICFPEVKLHDLGLCNVYGISPLKKLSSETQDRLRETEVQVLDGHLRLFSKPYDKERQMWQLAWPHTEEFARINQVQDKEAALQLCLSAARQWSGPGSWVADFVSATDAEDVIIHPLHDLDPSSLPVVQQLLAAREKNSSEERRGSDPTETTPFKSLNCKVLLVGDAAHPMAPYVGRGANEAIHDAWWLAKEFHGFFLPTTTSQEVEKVGSGGKEEASSIRGQKEKKGSHPSLLLHDAVRRYYEAMVDRTKQSVLLSRSNAEFYHQPDCMDLTKLAEFKQWAPHRTNSSELM